MDIFDRIAAAITLIIAGAKADAEELLGHINAIDEHLSDDETHNKAVDDNLTAGGADVNEENAHVAVVTAGLQTVIDATSTTTAAPVDAAPVTNEPPAGTPMTADEIAANTSPEGNVTTSDVPVSNVGSTTAE